MVAHLHATRPWLLFLAILGFALTVLIVGAALLMAIMGATIFSADGSMSEGAAMAMGLGLCAVYLLMGALYGFWSYLLLANARAIGAMRGATSVAALTSAMELSLDRQRRFWKITGIAAILSIVAYGGLMVVFIAFGIAAAAATAGAS
jgi:hypothetical protein